MSPCLCVWLSRMWTHFFLQSTLIAQQYMATLEPLRNLDHVLKAWLRFCHLVLIVAPVYTWHYFHLNFCRWWVLSLYWNTLRFTIFSICPTQKSLCENEARETRQIRLQKNVPVKNGVRTSWQGWCINSRVSRAQSKRVHCCSIVIWHLLYNTCPTTFSFTTISHFKPISCHKFILLKHTKSKCENCSEMTIFPSLVLWIL